MMPDQSTKRRGLIARLRRRWRERDLVTVCVPAYRSADVIAHTLQSIVDQTYRNIRVAISVDPSDDDTDKACEPFLADPRITLIRQATRLGWTGNVNFLLDRVRSDYFCIICHDDLIEPNYVARLLGRLRKDRHAVSAYPMFQRFGGEPSQAHIASIAGSRFERALGFFRQPLNAVALRGLTRTHALRAGLRLQDFGTGGFFAEFLWVFELAVLGACLRVGRTTYHSRYREDSVSNGWRAWSYEKKRAGWREVLLAVRDVIRRADFDRRQELELLDAALLWAYQLPIWMPATREERSMVTDPALRSALAQRWLEDAHGYPPVPDLSALPR